MSIDIHSDSLLTISQAAKSLPTRPNVSTVWRWIQRGVRGVKLDSVVVGGRRLTSKEALQSFVERSTANSSGASLPPSCPTSRQREAEIRSAEHEFDANI